MTLELEVSKVFILMGSYWVKYIFFELKKYRGIIFHETEERYKIWRGINLLLQIWHKEFEKIWLEHLKVSKIFILMCSYWVKYTLIELKKNRGIIFHETEEKYKIWRGIKLLLQNWHQEFDKIWPLHLKVSKIFILMGSYWVKYILFELKKKRGIIFHETEERYKIWGGIDLSFHSWHKQSDKFWPEYSKISKVFILMDSFWAIVSAKKSIEELSFMKLKENAKFGEKLTCCLKICIRNLRKFDPCTWKSQKFSF